MNSFFFYDAWIIVVVLNYRLKNSRKTLRRRMTFADEMAVVMSVRYERVYTWPVRTRNRLAAFPLTGPPQIRKVCAVFSSLSITHTPSTHQLYLCRTRSALADKWTRSNKDHLPENNNKKKIFKKKHVFRSMTIRRCWFLGNDWPGTWPITDDTPFLVYIVILYLKIILIFLWSFNSHIT